MKTSELAGMSLNWAVAKCLGWTEFDEDLQAFTQHETDGCGWLSLDYFQPSENWSQGGPLIEREKIDLFTEKNTPESWVASVSRYQNSKRLIGWRLHQYGSTPLIAAMRVYVASKLGDEVEIPEELLK